MTQTEMLTKIAEGYRFLHMAFRVDHFLGLVEQSVDGTQLINTENEADAEYKYKLMLSEGKGWIAADNAEQIKMMEKWVEKYLRFEHTKDKETWDAASERLFKQLYPTENWVVLCSIFNRQERTLKNKAHNMGLKRKTPLAKKRRAVA